VRAVRGGPAARLRLGVPAPGWSRERRVRSPARRTRARQGAARAVARRPGTRVDARGPRAARVPGGRSPRLADPERVRPGPARRRSRALRRRRGVGRRPVDGRGHRAGARDGDAGGNVDRARRVAPDGAGAVCVPRRPRPRARSALRGEVATVAAVAARRARVDPGGRPHPVDAPQLRALDVRGLSARADPDARPVGTAHVHASGRVRFVVVTARRSIDDLLAEARTRLVRVRPEDLDARMATGALVIDIRSAELRDRDGELPGALVVDRNVLEWRLDPSSAHRIAETGYERDVIVVCNEGYQSSLAAA